MEAPPGFGPGHKGFADLGLTTWLWCRNGNKSYNKFGKRLLRKRRTVLIPFQMERETGYCRLNRQLVTNERRSREKVVSKSVSANVCCANAEPSSSRFKWSGKRDSDPRPLPWQGSALPLSYSRSYGGSYRARTYDPLLVRQMLSQLS